MEQDEYILDNEFKFEHKVRYAGFWIRFGASLIDSLVMIPIVILTFYNIFMLKSFLFYVIIAIIGAMYKPLMEHYYGATVGKMAVSIKVVNPSLQRIDLGQSFLRSLPWLLQTGVGIVSMYFMFYTYGFDEVFEFMDFVSFQGSVDDPVSFLSSFISLFLLVTGIVIATNDFAQGLHDKMANTFVIYK